MINLHKILHKKIFSFIFIILVWSMLILPSCLFSNFSYLDDPTTVHWAQSFLEKNYKLLLPDNVTGRYFPVYFLYYALVHSIAGANPLGYYFVNSIIGLLILFLIYYITLKLTDSKLFAILSVLVGISSPPVAENFYTISKSEPRLLFIILIIYLLFISFITRTRRKNIVTCILWVVISILVIMAFYIKETAIFILIFPLSGFVLLHYFIRKNQYKDKKGVKEFYLLFIVCSSISILTGRILYLYLRSPNSTSNYVDYTVTIHLIMNNFIFYTTQQPEVLFLGVISLILLLIIFILKRFELKDNEIKYFIIACSLNLTGFGYLVILLIWKGALGYYTLIPAIMFSITFSFALNLYCKKICHKPVYVILLFLVLIKIYSLSYFVYIAYTQKLQDIVYNKAATCKISSP